MSSLFYFSIIYLNNYYVNNRDEHYLKKIITVADFDWQNLYYYNC